jgi:hypothetical protein
MTTSQLTLEAQLNDFDPAKRRATLDKLAALVEDGEIVFPEAGSAVNLHCHTFYSFNGYGYSPSYIAWKARCEGLAAAGTVDFDVLDAVDEFLEACQLLGLRGCGGLETRVYIPEYGDREINSPGEPGIAYFMGVGFVTGDVADAAIAAELKQVAQQRNQGMMARVNAHLAPVAVDYDGDVLPLSPKGNPTERHLCTALDLKAQQLFRDGAKRSAYWADKLGVTVDAVEKALLDPAALQGLIRSKLMKRGGVGYVQPDGAEFPSLERVNAFIRAEGAIPTCAWLDGTSDGEGDIEELLDFMTAAGVAAFNIIPDRNWNIKDSIVRAGKVAKLHEAVAAVQARDMPLIVGTEMNAPGQRFVDDFDAPEMAPLVGPALDGAHLLHAHTILQARRGMGYVSDWAGAQFATAKEKNAFFTALGRALAPADAGVLDGATPNMTPEGVLNLI